MVSSVPAFPLHERKPLRQPRSVAIFGASGHIGRPLAQQIRYVDPGVQLRLLTSSPAKSEELRTAFPDAECIVADLFDKQSLATAVRNMEGIFMVTPSPFDDERATTNLIDTVQASGDLIHLVRIVGYEPESLPRRVPEHVRRFGGTAHQHYVAKRLLDDSNLPVTYLNVGATYMDNLLAVAPAIKARRTLVWPDRLIPFIDARDLGEVAAHLLLSTDGRHLHQFHTVNNGVDLLTTTDLARVFSDVLKVPISVDLQRDTFIREYGARLAARRGVDHAAEGVLDFIEYEQGNAAFFSLNDFAERMLGRKPTSLRAWIMEHRSHFS